MADASFDFDKYLAEKKAPQASAASAPADFDFDKYLKEKQAPGDPFSKSGIDAMLSGKAQMPKMGVPSIYSPEAGVAARGIGRTMDYAGGLVRGGLLGGALAAKGAMTGNQTDISNAGRMTSDALSGSKAPATADYLEKLGVPEGAKVSDKIPVIGGASVRGAAGLVGDMATDPMTYLAPEAKVANSAAEAGGKAAYASGLKKIDERLAETGAKPLSDVLLEHGAPSGSTQDIQKSAQGIANDISKQRSDLYQAANEKGVTVDLSNSLPNTERVLAKMYRNPGLEDKAAQLNDWLNKYRNAGKVPIDLASEWKTSLYDALPEAAYQEHAGVSNIGQEFKQALASDIRNEIVGAGNKAEKGLGDKIDSLNEDWGSLIGAEKPLALQIRRGTTHNLGTSVDGILMGTGHAAAIPIKKAFDLSKTTTARTNVGKGLMMLGNSKAAGGLVRQGLMGAGQPMAGQQP